MTGFDDMPADEITALELDALIEKCPEAVQSHIMCLSDACAMFEMNAERGRYMEAVIEEVRKIRIKHDRECEWKMEGRICQCPLCVTHRKLEGGK